MSCPWGSQRDEAPGWEETLASVLPQLYIPCGPKTGFLIRVLQGHVGAASCRVQEQMLKVL